MRFYTKTSLLFVLCFSSLPAQAENILFIKCINALRHAFSVSYREELALDNFMADKSIHSDWLHYKGYKVYFRINEVLWKNQPKRVLVISNISSDKPGSGGYLKFLEALDTKVRKYSLDGIKIEGVSGVGEESQQRQVSFYLRNGFEQLNSLTSYSLDFYRPTAPLAP